MVHGVLHLAGYDHERDRDAKPMEPLEVKIPSARLGNCGPPQGLCMSSDGDSSVWQKLVRALQGERAADHAAMRETIEEAIEESERRVAGLSQAERVMLANLLKFGELRLKDVMVPRAAIIAVDETVPMS